MPAIRRKAQLSRHEHVAPRLLPGCGSGEQQSPALVALSIQQNDLIEETAQLCAQPPQPLYHHGKSGHGCLSCGKAQPSRGSLDLAYPVAAALV